MKKTYKRNKGDNEYKSKGKKHCKNHLGDDKKAMEECPRHRIQMNQSSQIFYMQWRKAHLLESPSLIGFTLHPRLGSRPRFPPMKSTHFGDFLHDING
jgi:hypothetical protein